MGVAKVLRENNRLLRIIIAYRANESGGRYTAYAKHQAYYNTINKNRWEPRQQMLNNLKGETDLWKRSREQVVLMMYCTEDICASHFQKFLEDVGMKEIILERQRQDAPATHIAGKLLIDGIFAPAAIEIAKGGYPSFAEGSPRPKDGPLMHMG